MAISCFQERVPEWGNNVKRNMSDTEGPILHVLAHTRFIGGQRVLTGNQNWFVLLPEEQQWGGS